MRWLKYISCCLIVGVAELRAQRITPDMVEQTRKALDAFVHDQWAVISPMLGGTMREKFTADAFHQGRAALQAQFGSFQKIAGEPRVEAVGGIQRVTIPVAFAKGTLWFQAAYSGDGKIQGIFFVPPQPEAAPTAPGASATTAPPPYVKPGSFTEREVTVGSGEWQLPGTLTVPKGSGPFPAVVLVHGSGPNDRNESIFGNQPFRDVAEGLASQGIAALRYEKRTKQYGGRTASIKNLTVMDETIDDAVAAVKLLALTKGIDAKRIFVLGHSLGGMLAPRIATAEPTVAGLILFAGGNRPLAEVMQEQLGYLGTLPENGSPQAKERIATMRANAEKMGDAKVTAMDPSAAVIPGVPASYLQDLNRYDPLATIRELHRPVLVLQGERDYNVTEKDYERWRQALAGRTDATFHLYPGLNHYFYPGQGTPKSRPAELTQPGQHVAAQVIDDIAAWVKGR